ncbi:MAG: hypothetical protein M9958_04270 [Chitinophagales bacterium]|nr:hypothetical protein [Chitinophagales bacterium]
MKINKYWTKDLTRSEIITKTQISNKGNFDFFATYFNLMDKKGLALTLNENSTIETNSLFKKNGFEYIVLQHENYNEFLILPNENLEVLTEKIVFNIDNCNAETDVLNLIIEEM